MDLVLAQQALLWLKHLIAFSVKLVATTVLHALELLIIVQLAPQDSLSKQINVYVVLVPILQPATPNAYLVWITAMFVRELTLEP